MLAYKLLIPLVLVNIPCTYPLSSEPIESKTTFLRKIISNVHKERPIETFLIMERPQNQQCLLQSGIADEIPTLRFDETVKISLKKLYNSEALILVCMSEVADVVLLDTLAENTNRMRGARIIIWLYNEVSILSDLMRLIVEQAKAHNFLNLLVFHQASNNVQEPITPYQLQPFPTPTLQRITDMDETQIFSKVHSNFRGKTAVILPDLIHPKSIETKDPLTGKYELYGSSEVLIKEFAKKYNIKLALHPLFKKIQNPLEVFNLTLQGEIDLPIRYFSYKDKPSSIEYLSNLEKGSIFIVIPCGREMLIGDIYKGLKNYSAIVLGAYFMFAIIETVCVFASKRFFWGRYKFPCSHLFVNLRVFCGVLGLPIRFNRYRSSFSLQQIVLVLSFFGIILSCFFNANLSTLLTKQPQQKQIRNFKELHDSGIPLAANKIFMYFIATKVDKEFYKIIAPDIKYLTIKEASDLLLSLNNSFAHVVYSKTWKFLNKYQKDKNINALCETTGLTLTNSVFLSGVVKNNSIFKEAFEDFFSSTKSMGLLKHWKKQAASKSLQFVRSTQGKSISQNYQAFTPLSLGDFKWLCRLMGFFYGLSSVIFIGEILFARWQKKQVKKVVIIEV